jgi:ubiquitin-like protein Pup
MARQERKEKPAVSKAEEATPPPMPTEAEKAEKLKADTDTLLDEIDEILANNAAEFVESYVQAGGE